MSLKRRPGGLPASRNYAIGGRKNAAASRRSGAPLEKRGSRASGEDGSSEIDDSAASAIPAPHEPARPIAVDGQCGASGALPPSDEPARSTLGPIPCVQKPEGAGASVDVVVVTDISMRHVDAQSPCTAPAVRAMSAKSAAM